MSFHKLCFVGSICLVALGSAKSSLAQDQAQPRKSSRSSRAVAVPGKLGPGLVAQRSRSTVKARSQANATVLGLRLPTFLAFGVGGLGASGAVVTGILAQNESTAQALHCKTDCRDGRAAPDSTLTITSGVLSGVAAVGVGVGLGLMLTAPKRPEDSRLTPRLKLGLSPQKAAASAVWRF